MRYVRAGSAVNKRRGPLYRLAFSGRDRGNQNSPFKRQYLRKDSNKLGKAFLSRAERILSPSDVLHVWP